MEAPGFMYVEDVDAVVKQAVDAGATVTMEVTDQFWGDRFGSLSDPFGHSWLIATRVEDLSPEEISERGKGGDGRDEQLGLGRSRRRRARRARDQARRRWSLSRRKRGSVSAAGERELGADRAVTHDRPQSEPATRVVRHALTNAAVGGALACWRLSCLLVR
jgi:hypothetical protein